MQKKSKVDRIAIGQALENVIPLTFPPGAGLLGTSMAPDRCLRTRQAWATTKWIADCAWHTRAALSLSLGGRRRKTLLRAVHAAARHRQRSEGCCNYARGAGVQTRIHGLQKRCMCARGADVPAPAPRTLLIDPPRAGAPARRGGTILRKCDYTTGTQEGTVPHRDKPA
eukprot:3066459-Prymnesium_polylepis.2